MKKFFDVPLKADKRKERLKNLKLEFNVPKDLVGSIQTDVNMSPKEGNPEDKLQHVAGLNYQFYEEETKQSESSSHVKIMSIKK